MHLPRPLAILLAVACLPPTGCGRPAEVAAPPPHEVAFAEHVRPVLGDYCTGCHGGEEPEGGLSFEAYADGGEVPGLEDLRTRTDFFERVAHHVMNGSMPPDGLPAPEPAQRDAFVGWFTDTIAEAWRVAPPNPGRVTMRRLNRAEYRNTVRDLLGVDYDTSQTFPLDEVGYGFDHIGDVLSLPPLLFEKYLDAAETIAARAVPLPLRRYEAEHARMSGAAHARGDVARMNSAGEVVQTITLDDPGTYVVRARVLAEQAGPDKARVTFRVGQRVVAEPDVSAPSGRFQEHEVAVPLEPGRHRIAIGFFNDYWRPKHPDPAQRDRNLVVDWFEIERQGESTRTKSVHRPDKVLSWLPAPGDERACAERVLGPLLERAFRRPIPSETLERYVGLVLQAMAAGETFEGGMQTALQAMLIAPQFLFRMELDETTGGAARRLDGYELASRLSYFLWASGPDAALLAAAGDGTLHASIHEHVTRMLADPRARTLVTNFAAQWLTLRRLDTALPDPRKYKHVDDAMRGWMRQETELFVEAIIREDRNILDLIDAPFTYLNEPLAAFYGIPGVTGGEFRRVDLRGRPERGGLLGHASILTLTSYPHRTSPVLRGKWVMEEILGTPPPPPPPGVGTLEAQDPELLKRSVRERLAIHREDPTCAVCHDGMDNLGYGLENFDPVGAWRTRDGPQRIDASGVLPGGRSFRGPAELKQILRADPGVPRCFAEKLLTYALGRGLEPYDRPAVLQIVREASERRFRFSAFVHAIVATDAFTMRRTAGDAR